MADNPGNPPPPEEDVPDLVPDDGSASPCQFDCQDPAHNHPQAPPPLRQTDHLPDPDIPFDGSTGTFLPPPPPPPVVDDPPEPISPLGLGSPLLPVPDPNVAPRQRNRVARLYRRHRDPRPAGGLGPGPARVESPRGAGARNSRRYWTRTWQRVHEAWDRTRPARARWRQCVSGPRSGRTGPGDGRPGEERGDPGGNNGFADVDSYP